MIISSYESDSAVDDLALLKATEVYLALLNTSDRKVSEKTLAHSGEPFDDTKQNANQIGKPEGSSAKETSS